ncbi:putative polygalacturonase [Vitis vinifera]|nr:putative polygalacturonase [Vitis vinifera]
MLLLRLSLFCCSSFLGVLLLLPLFFFFFLFGHQGIIAAEALTTHEDASNGHRVFAVKGFSFDVGIGMILCVLEYSTRDFPSLSTLAPHMILVLLQFSNLQLPLLVILVLSNAVESNGQERGGQCTNSLTLDPRPHSVSILEFGAVGDGKTLNTIAFQNAIFYLKSFADKVALSFMCHQGSGLLEVSISRATSHSSWKEDPSHWEVIEPLPSYGRGIELPGGRYRSLINGYMLRDVVITGDNGTINGQGSVWWDWFTSHSLNYSRPHLVEFLASTNVVVSNLTFLNAPAYNIHPVYCSNVRVQNISVYAPPESPYTVGIVPGARDSNLVGGPNGRMVGSQGRVHAMKIIWLALRGRVHAMKKIWLAFREGFMPCEEFDSSDSTCIEDCSIAMGHDAIALKSGWDEYGIAYGRPTTNVHIRRVNLQSSSGSSLAFGSEMSGGISNVCVEQVHLYNSFSGIEFRTTKGRGGYIQEIIISDVAMENIHTAFSATGQIGSHPDDHFDPNALPVLDHITLQNVIGTNITIAGSFTGIQESPFTSICLSNISLSTTPPASISWVCSNVSGFSQWVFPEPCPSLESSLLNSSSTCLSRLNSSPTQTAVL